MTEKQHEFEEASRKRKGGGRLTSTTNSRKAGFEGKRPGVRKVKKLKAKETNTRVGTREASAKRLIREKHGI